jgi:flagellar basal-body rod protein FlgC
MNILAFFVVLSASFSAFSGMQTTGCRLVMENRRTQMNLIAENLANVNTTKTASGLPYHKQVHVCHEEKCRIEKSSLALVKKYFPKHPDADENGYVQLPDIDIHSEMESMIKAQRDYEAAAQKCI